MTRVKQGLKRQAMAEHTSSSDAKQARLASGASAAPSSLVLSEDEEERLGALSSFNAWKRKVERARGASACIKVDRVVRSCGGFNERYEPLRFLDVETCGQTLHLAFHGVLAAQAEAIFAARPLESSAFVLSGFGATLAPSPLPGTEEAIVEYRERRVALKALWKDALWLEVIDGKLQGAEVRDLVAEAAKAAAVPGQPTNEVAKEAAPVPAAAVAAVSTPAKQAAATSGAKQATKSVSLAEVVVKAAPSPAAAQPNRSAAAQPRPASRNASAGPSKSVAAKPAQAAPSRQVTPPSSKAQGQPPAGSWFNTPPQQRVQEVKPNVAAAAAANRGVSAVVARPASVAAAAAPRRPPPPQVQQLGQHKYTPICMLRNGERANIMGVVVTEKEPKHAVGGSGDAMFNVSLKDLSGRLLSINIFKRELREIPSPAPLGSILLLRSIVNQSITALQYKQNRDWAVLDATTQMIRQSPTMMVSLCREEEEAMYTFFQQAQAASLADDKPRGRPTVTLSKLEVRVYCDVVAEVLKVFVPTSNTGHPPQLFVTDYTSHPLLPRANDVKLGVYTAEEVDEACAVQGQGGGSVLGISLWDSNQAAGELLNPGDLVRLGNVFPRMQPNEFMGAGMGNSLKISSVKLENSEPARALMKRKQALIKKRLDREVDNDFDLDDAALKALDEAESLHGAASRRGSGDDAAAAVPAPAAAAAPKANEAAPAKGIVSASALLPAACQGDLQEDEIMRMLEDDNVRAPRQRRGVVTDSQDEVMGPKGRVMLKSTSFEKNDDGVDEDEDELEAEAEAHALEQARAHEAAAARKAKGKGKARERVEAVDEMDVDVPEEEDVKPIIKATPEAEAASMSGATAVATAPRSSAVTAEAAALSGTTANGTLRTRFAPVASACVSTPPATPPPSTPPPAQRVLAVKQATGPVTASGFSASPERSLPAPSKSSPSKSSSGQEAKSSGAQSTPERSAPVICDVEANVTSISALQAMDWRKRDDRPVRLRVRVKACKPVDVDDWVIAECGLCKAVLPKEHAFCVPCADEDAKDVHYRFFFALLVEDASESGSGTLPLAMRDAQEFLRDFTPADVRRDPRALKRLRMRLEPILGYAKAQNVSPTEYSEEELGGPLPFDAGVTVYQAPQPDAKRAAFLTGTVLRKFGAMRARQS